jgi:hypothetical protein
MDGMTVSPSTIYRRLKAAKDRTSLTPVNMSVNMALDRDMEAKDKKIKSLQAELELVNRRNEAVEIELKMFKDLCVLLSNISMNSIVAHPYIDDVMSDIITSPHEKVFHEYVPIHRQQSRRGSGLDD